MKIIILSLALVALMMGTVYTSFGQKLNRQPIKARVDLNETQKQVSVTKMNLMEIQKDSISDFQKFKQNADSKIIANEKNIADLKKKLDKTDLIIQKRISKLLQNNNDLKKSLTDYKDKGQYEWDSFKNLFNYDMSELKKELKELDDNKK